MENHNEPDSDLQRLWARNTEDLDALEVFYFITLRCEIPALTEDPDFKNYPNFILSPQSNYISV